MPVTIYLQPYIIRQFPSRYQAAKALIEARVKGIKLNLPGKFDWSTEAIFKAETKRTPCQTWVSKATAGELYGQHALRSCSLSEFVREALR